MFGSSSNTSLGGIGSISQQRGGGSITEIFNRDSSATIGGFTASSHDNGLVATNTIGGTTFHTPGYALVEGGTLAAQGAVAAMTMHRPQQAASSRVSGANQKGMVVAQNKQAAL